jgi:hypothetical protein
MAAQLGPGLMSLIILDSTMLDEERQGGCWNSIWWYGSFFCRLVNTRSFTCSSGQAGGQA